MFQCLSGNEWQHNGMPTLQDIQKVIEDAIAGDAQREACKRIEIAFCQNRAQSIRNLATRKQNKGCVFE